MRKNNFKLLKSIFFIVINYLLEINTQTNLNTCATFWFIVFFFKCKQIKFKKWQKFLFIVIEFKVQNT